MNREIYTFLMSPATASSRIRHGALQTNMRGTRWFQDLEIW